MPRTSKKMLSWNAADLLFKYTSIQDIAFLEQWGMLKLSFWVKKISCVPHNSNRISYSVEFHPWGGETRLWCLPCIRWLNQLALGGWWTSFWVFIADICILHRISLLASQKCRVPSTQFISVEQASTISSQVAQVKLMNWDELESCLETWEAVGSAGLWNSIGLSRCGC